MDDRVFDDRAMDAERDKGQENERLEKLPDFERDSGTAIGGGVSEMGGTATDSGTGTVAAASGRRDLEAEGHPDEEPLPNLIDEGRDDDEGVERGVGAPPPTQQ